MVNHLRRPSTQDFHNVNTISLRSRYGIEVRSVDES